MTYAYFTEWLEGEAREKFDASLDGDLGTPTESASKPRSRNVDQLMRVMGGAH